MIATELELKPAVRGDSADLAAGREELQPRRAGARVHTAEDSERTRV